MRKLIVLIVLLMPMALTQGVCAEEDLNKFDARALKLAERCREEIVAQFDLLLQSGKLTMPQLFDTFYIPIPKTDPQKFHTQYDRMTDGILQPILDTYLEASSRFVFFVLVDKNGYLPTHNTRYAQPLTGDPDVDVKKNRTKRIFNDRTGLAAARNLEPVLIQRYQRDTGEHMTDLSVPVYIRDQHWGAIRIGYQ